jgi:hypothetical protein
MFVVHSCILFCYYFKYLTIGCPIYAPSVGSLLGVFALKYFGNGSKDGHTKKTMQKYIARMKWYPKYNKENEYNFHLKKN